MNVPELPRVLVDTTMPVQGGTTHSCTTAGQFTTALANAVLGDIIELQAGTTFAGPFTLPNRTSGSGWIVIRSSLHGNLPEGTRVGPGSVSNMATITGNGSPVIAVDTVATAHHFRFIGIDFKPASGLFATSLIRLGTGSETSEASLPHHIIFDRCYIHGDPTVGGRRGIFAHANHFALIDSYMSMWADTASDAQCLSSTNGAGPFKIVNNYLEGAAENIIFGGGDPGITNLRPSDITIERNLFTKPLTWNENHGSYAGTPWSIKNLFELKNAQRVLVNGNIFENCWIGIVNPTQNGQAISVRSANQDGGASWSGSLDITIVNNIIRHCCQAFDIAGDATFNGVVSAQRILIKNNLCYDVGVTMGGEGTFTKLTNGALDVTVDHNTCVDAPSYLLNASDWGVTRLVWRNNICPHGIYGVKGAGTTTGNNTLTAYYPSAVFTKNVIVDADDAGFGSADYPANNFFPSELSNVGFTNLAGGDYRLTPASAYYKAATDGTDVGANINVLEAAQVGINNAVFFFR